MTVTMLLGPLACCLCMLLDARNWNPLGRVLPREMKQMAMGMACFFSLLSVSVYTFLGIYAGDSKTNVDVAVVLIPLVLYLLFVISFALWYNERTCVSPSSALSENGKGVREHVKLRRLGDGTMWQARKASEQAGRMRELLNASQDSARLLGTLQERYSFELREEDRDFMRGMKPVLTSERQLTFEEFMSLRRAFFRPFVEGDALSTDSRVHGGDIMLFLLFRATRLFPFYNYTIVFFMGVAAILSGLAGGVLFYNGTPAASSSYSLHLAIYTPFVLLPLMLITTDAWEKARFGAKLAEDMLHLVNNVGSESWRVGLGWQTVPGRGSGYFDLLSTIYCAANHLLDSELRCSTHPQLLAYPVFLAPIAYSAFTNSWMTSPATWFAVPSAAALLLLLMPQLYWRYRAWRLHAELPARLTELYARSMGRMQGLAEE
eukprot:PLAT6920.1.p1 GENE.PLAT6920.1~~PLAT6920.1.p1  ORF type:complete len:479 (+),score=219.85 PLAT6920.1:141-1439(+)